MGQVFLSMKSGSNQPNLASQQRYLYPCGNGLRRFDSLPTHLIKTNLGLCLGQRTRILKTCQPYKRYLRFPRPGSTMMYASWQQWPLWRRHSAGPCKQSVRRALSREVGNEPVENRYEEDALSGTTPELWVETRYLLQDGGLDTTSGSWRYPPLLNQQ